jgi:hypothetical protein
MTVRSTARATARPLAFLAGVAVLVAACGGGTASPGATSADGSSSAPATQAPATQAPAGTNGSEPSMGLPSFDLPSGDEELEDLLPDDIAGEAVTKFSMTGDALGGMASPEIQAVLDQFNKTPSDLSVAFGSTNAVALFAYRIKGVEGSQFFNEFLVAAGAEGEVTVTDAAYGGKAVKKVVSANEDIGTVYVHTAGDVMYIVGDDNITDALLNEAFSKIG